MDISAGFIFDKLLEYDITKICWICRYQYSTRSLNINSVRASPLFNILQI